MNKKHLIWIIPICIFIGLVVGIGFYGHLQINENQHMFQIAMSCMSELYNVSVPNLCR